MSYTFHPDPVYGVEFRDGLTEDDYIAQARGFRSTRDWLEYRDAAPARQAEIRRERERRDSADCDEFRTYLDDLMDRN